MCTIYVMNKFTDNGVDYCRSSGCSELDSQSYGAFVSHRVARHFRHHNLRHHRTGAVLRQPSQDLLAQRHRHWHTYVTLAYSFMSIGSRVPGSGKKLPDPG